MQAHQVDLSRKSDINQFIQLPFHIYKNNPYWVPSMRSDMLAMLDREKHPYYQHSDAGFFMVKENGKVLARVGIFNNKRYNEMNGTRTAFFYFFEAFNHPEAVQLLFEKAFEWAREEGLTECYGPKGALQGDGIGLLVKGFDCLPAMGIAYNPPYYEDLLTGIGFGRGSDYYSGKLNTDMQVSEQVYRVAEKVKQRRGFWVEKFETKEELLAVAPRIRRVYNAAFSDGEGFNLITEEEMVAIARRMLSIADPRLIKLVYKGEEIIGFLFAYHNIGEGIRKARGRIWPLGWWHLMRAYKTTKTVDVNGIGILPEHQGLGATAVLYIEMAKTIREFGFENAEVVQIREDNIQSLGEASVFDLQFHKIHRVYRIRL